MKISNFSYEILDVPSPIRDKLVEISKDIEITKRSRSGACGWLFFGKNKIHGQNVAIKFYDWGGEAKYHIEPKHLASIESNNVIKILDASHVNDDYAYFLTSYCSNGDLDKEILNGIRGNKRAVSVTRDILLGLSFLHSKNLLHRDLKAENILIDDDDKAIIGDFGSVKKIPEGQSSIPGSGHSLIYTPPESISTGEYGIPGDIYQVGVVLFQLLGGYLPYDDPSWLNPREIKKYRLITDEIERQIFAKECIKNKIEKGNVVDLSTLPPWVCKPLRLTVSKACNIKPEKRYQSSSEFLARLNSISKKVNDWTIENGYPIRNCSNCRYRVIYNRKKQSYFVEKEKNAGWRKDNSFKGTSLNELIKEIENRH